MDSKSLQVRVDLVVDLVVVATSITVAIWMHRTDSTYSCLKAPCPPLQVGYPVIDRLGLGVAGLLVAGIVVAFGSFMRPHLRERRPWRGRTAARQR